MTKKDYIKYWVDTANNDWEAITVLIKGKKYIYALFFAHLVLEKLCKAHWVKDNKENHPPKIHNLVYLVEQTKLELTEEDMEFLRRMNNFQLEGRYPDYTRNLSISYREKNTTGILKQVNILRLCLLKKLQ